MTFLIKIFYDENKTLLESRKIKLLVDLIIVCLKVGTRFVKKIVDNFFQN